MNTKKYKLSTGQFLFVHEDLPPLLDLLQPKSDATDSLALRLSSIVGLAYAQGASAGMAAAKQQESTPSV